MRGLQAYHCHNLVILENNSVLDGYFEGLVVLDNKTNYYVE